MQSLMDDSGQGKTCIVTIRIIDNVAVYNALQHGEVTPEPLYRKECPSGRVYVYDLPPEFHKDLVLHDCTDLDRWHRECDIITNHGYGRSVAELRRIFPDDLKNLKGWFHMPVKKKNGFVVYSDGFLGLKLKD